MKIAVCSDEPYAINQFVVKELLTDGHDVKLFGSLLSGRDESWAKTAKIAALAVVNGECEAGVFFCYTGTGVAMAANKIPGIRAALCTDEETARSARIWNHANVLVLSNRLLSESIAKEILSAWLTTPVDARGYQSVMDLAEIDREFRK